MEEIHAAARKLLVERGPAAVTVNAVAREVGMSGPALYHYYAGHDELVAAVTAGFFLHSRWSFKGHGTRRRGGWQQAQFVGVQATGMALNALVTWIGTAAFGLPPWAPLLPAVALATIVTFILNRWLVFA